MSQVSGVVQGITTRNVAGGKTAYGVRVGGQEYGAGLYAPKCKEGDYVTFDVEENRGFKNVARGSLQVSKNKPAKEYNERPSSASSSYSKPAASSFDARQDAISRQAASNTAIGFIELLLKAEALPLGKTKRQEAVEKYLHHYEKMFYEQNTGVVWKDINPNKTAEEEEFAAEDDEEFADPDDAKWE